MVLTDQQKIGVMLSGMGLFFTFFGVMMFFDRGLLAIGNLLFLSGIALGLGLTRTFNFFFQMKKAKGTVCFFFGIFLVILGRTFIGLIIEAFGFINLFGDAFPIVIAILRKLPVIGNILNHPTVNRWLNKTEAGSELPF
ncbi:golgi transport protein 1 [Cavenderia fasciculata]|uniref:Golgi transport protein 1 n=1 Tax=Cavenderia fasciculata TaxID=261658 RepID=F4QAT8_CACFS|nr:golgi transport protein 1 [Cavenderia fasciculata]EGG14997.1 golgi transport protein 1 [Cavenderia fasciculata]|eukprot:XP_004351717.1 golgi transport protein 1 [Cavenderia fasciculata]